MFILFICPWNTCLVRVHIPPHFPGHWGAMYVDRDDKTLQYSTYEAEEYVRPCGAHRRGQVAPLERRVWKINGACLVMEGVGGETGKKQEYQLGAEECEEIS